MKGRKPLYKPETLKIGGKMPLPKDKKQFGHQYARAFNERFTEMTFKFVDGFIQRVA